MYPLSLRKQKHMLAVAEYMRLRAKDYGIDPMQAYIVGFLHDVGYMNAKKGHGQAGEKCLLDMGLEHEYRYAIRYHGVSPYHISEANVDMEPEDLLRAPYVLYEDVAEWTKKQRFYPLLLEADLRVDTLGNLVGFQKRLEDLIARYDNPEITENARSSIAYVFEWCDKNNVPRPPALKNIQPRMWQDRLE